MSAPASPWTPEEDVLLRSIGAAGESVAAIAMLLKRSPHAVRAGLLTQDQVGPFAARAEGEEEIVVTWGNRWTSQQDALFRRMAEANTRPEVIAAKLNRLVRAIKARAYVIGLPLKWSKLKAKGK
jgi:hypothetical protein